jgi:CheY-like chemotaxis protein
MAHILLIDDDPDFSAALSVAMRGAGYSLTCVGSCAEGLDALTAMSDEHKPDAVLVDMFMPDADGFETIHALRDVGIEAPVIAISGGCSKRPDSVLTWAKSLGADGSLAKPFPIANLITLLNAIGPRRELMS